ncbi:zinc finger protein 235-like isoform X2 [Zootermopsis nevadensis]|uniref:zinc finger protein 235-like isoform X2 n=1 Tax=Zootermopsis nevadensis TaxID=136037 RepID=UPI000B8E27EE|nr:zinc finger protein 235-like isoform X2 [Zootermopsis nevadensis]
MCGCSLLHLLQTHNMDIVSVDPNSDPATQPLHTVPVKEEKMFVISDVIGGAEFFGTDVGRYLCAVAEGVMKAEPKEDITEVKKEVESDLSVENHRLNHQGVLGLCSETLVKQEEEDQSAAADYIEQPPPSRSVIPLLQNTQGCDSHIASDCGGSLKLSALVKKECSGCTETCSEVCADDNKESTSDHEQTDSCVEDSKSIVDTFISDFSKCVQRCSNKPMPVDPLVMLPRSQLSTAESSGMELQDGESDVSSLKGAPVVERPTEWDVNQRADCLHSVNDPEVKTSIISQKINKHTAQKNVKVDDVEKLPKEYSESKSKQHDSGSNSAKIQEQELVTGGKSMMQMDKTEDLPIGRVAKRPRRSSSNYESMKCVSDCNSTEDKNVEVKLDLMRPGDSCQVEQKKTVKARGTVKPHRDLSSKYRMMRRSRADADDAPYRCDRCDKRYATSRGLRDHHAFHTGSRPFVCKVCAKMFPTLMRLVKHSQRHTREKAYECQLCDKKFRFLMSLKKHILFHTGERPFECILCNKRFFTSLDLKNHIHIHTGEKPFACKLCWKGFSSAASLRKHRFHHARGKPYFCGSCNVQFERYKLLRLHIQRHKVKKYECGECHKAFPSSELLETHALIHSGVRPYGCPLCNSTFSKMVSLMCHYHSHKRFNHRGVIFKHVKEPAETMLTFE